MDITTNLYQSVKLVESQICYSDLDWCFEFEKNRLRNEDLSSFCTEIPNLGFEQLNLFPWSTSSHLEQSINYRVQIHLILISHCCLTPSRQKRKTQRKLDSRTMTRNGWEGDSLRMAGRPSECFNNIWCWQLSVRSNSYFAEQADNNAAISNRFGWICGEMLTILDWRFPTLRLHAARWLNRCLVDVRCIKSIARRVFCG